MLQCFPKVTEQNLKAKANFILAQHDLIMRNNIYKLA